MDMTSSDERRLADRNMRERVEQLLERYPDLSLEETALILRFLKKGPFLETGLLSSNETIRPKLERFRADHRKQLSAGSRSLAIAALLVFLIIVAVVLLWDAGAGR